MQNFVQLGISENFQPIGQSKLANCNQFYLSKPVGSNQEARKAPQASTHDLRSIKQDLLEVERILEVAPQYSI